jgi:hypothetical protein
VADFVQEHISQVLPENGEIRTVEDLDRITSNDRMECLYCGCAITPENDSGWEAFVDGLTTQRICRDCETGPKYNPSGHKVDGGE